MTASPTDSGNESGQRFRIKTPIQAFEEYTHMELNRLRETEPDFDQPQFEEARALVLELLNAASEDEEERT